MRQAAGLLLCLFLGLSVISAQDIGLGDPEMLLVRKRQWDIYGTIHTNGFGGGVHIDQIKNIHLQHGLDIEYTYYRHFKEQRMSLGEGKNLTYGKKNYFAMLRAGYGFTKILTTKHYSGGVELGYFFYGGFSLGFSVPVYLNILYLNYSSGKPEIETRTEIYNENIHNLGNIYEKAPFYKGFKNMKFHPGLYMKTGLSFDFSSDDSFVVKLDLGVAIDAYAIPIQKMAFVNKQYVLFTGYVALHLGNRKAKYE